MQQLKYKFTKEVQSDLSQYCRDGLPTAIPGATTGRIHHYRRLVFNVVKDALSSTYPFCHQMLSTKEWENLCAEFFANHRCQHPQVWRMPEELMAYMVTSKSELMKKYPHIQDLLLFEWKEVEYYMMQDMEQPPGSRDMLHTPWSLNLEAEIMHLSYPVHAKNARYISISDRSDYYILIFRQPLTFKVRFLQISAFYAWLLTNMWERNASVKKLMPEINEQFGRISPEILEQNLSQFYEKLIADGMVI